MKISRILFFGLLASGTALGQDTTFRFFNQDYYRDRLRVPKPRVLEEPSTSSQLPWNPGEHVKTEFSFAATDDIIDNALGKDEDSDEGLDTWGYLVRLRERRRHGDLTFDLLGRLSMDRLQDPVNPNLSEFAEMVDGTATWRPLPEPSGLGYEVNGGFRYVGNKYHGNFLSPAAQAKMAHNDWGWGSETEFASGDVEAWCGKLGGAFTYQVEGDDYKWFCTLRVRAEGVVQLDKPSSNTLEQSNVGFDSRVGFPIIQGNTEIPIWTFEPHFSTTQLLREGNGNLETMVGGDFVFRYELLGLKTTNWINIDYPLSRFSVIPVDDQELDIPNPSNLLIRIGGSFTF